MLGPADTLAAPGPGASPLPALRTRARTTAGDGVSMPDAAESRHLAHRNRQDVAIRHSDSASSGC